MTLSLSFIFYHGWHQNLGVFGKFLSHPWLHFVAKFNFSTFMIHYLFIWYENATAHYVFDYVDNRLATVQRFISTVVVSNILGLFVYLLFEAPTNSLLRALIH